MGSVEIELNKARKHHRDCNITRSVGASVLGVGGAASLALIVSPITSEESATLTVPLLIIGCILILGAFVGDLIRSILFLRKARELAYSDERGKENFIAAVRQFEAILLELLHVDGMVLEQCEDLRAALDNDSAACRKIRRAIDNYPWSSHINEIMLKSSTSALSLTVKGLAEFYGPGLCSVLTWTECLSVNFELLCHISSSENQVETFWSQKTQINDANVPQNS
jgi:hypothetical protein